MKIPKKLLFACLCVSLLTGCWDQNLLNDVKLVLTTGLDLSPDGKTLGTITIPAFATGEGGTTSSKSQVISATGYTTRDMRNQMNLKVSGEFNSTKLVILLVGEEYAKQDIYSGLDVFYRDPKSSLVEKLAVVKGRATDLLNLKLKEQTTMSTYLDGLFENAQVNTIIPRQTRPIFSDILDPGSDIVLPLIRAKANEAEIIGLALFNKNQYTGKYLTIQESTLFMLMDNHKNKNARIKVKIHENQKPEMKNYIYFDVLKSKRRLKINNDKPDDISVKLSLNLTVEIMEYAEDHLYSEKIINDLQEKISEDLTKRANKILKKIQQANCDSLSIGRHMIAYHPDTWKNMNWEQKYPTITFEAKVNVEITKHGVFY